MEPRAETPQPIPQEELEKTVLAPESIDESSRKKDTLNDPSSFQTLAQMQVENRELATNYKEIAGTGDFVHKNAEENIDKAHERALRTSVRMERTYYEGGDRKWGERIAQQMDDLEQEASVIREVGWGELEAFTSHPGDLIHVDRKAQYSIRQWLATARGQEELAYRPAVHSDEEAMSVHLTPLQPKYLRYAIRNIEDRLKERGLESLNPAFTASDYRIRDIHYSPAKPGLAVVFSEEMKEKLKSPNISDDYVFNVVSEAHRAYSEYMPQEIQDDPLKSRYERLETYRQAVRELLGKFNLPTGPNDTEYLSILSLAAFYRALSQHDPDLARKSEDIMFNSSIWDTDDFGVRLTGLSYDQEGRIVKVPHQITRNDISAFILPSSEGRFVLAEL